MDAKEKMRREDDNASAIAEKLLQGWTMLAEYCPVEGCTTPLMRSRENKVFCVAHNMFVMSAEEAEAMKRDGKGVNGTPAPAAPSSHEQEAFEESEPPGVESLDDDFYNKLRAGSDVGAGAGVSLSRKISSAAAASSGTRAAFAAPANGARTTEDPREVPRSALDPAIAATARATAMTLAEKMEEARTVLASKRVADDGRRIDECAHVVSLIDAIAGTLAKLEPISRT
jgi:uncharacterized Zn finger protein (UPF0148 family)